jgi:hypothetical protein
MGDHHYLSLDLEKTTGKHITSIKLLNWKSALEVVIQTVVLHGFPKYCTYLDSDFKQATEPSFCIHHRGYCFSFQCSSVELKTMACHCNTSVVVFTQWLTTIECKITNHLYSHTIKQLLYKIFLHHIRMYIHAFIHSCTWSLYTCYWTPSCSWVTVPGYEISWWWESRLLVVSTVSEERTASLHKYPEEGGRRFDPSLILITTCRPMCCY